MVRKKSQPCPSEAAGARIGPRMPASEAQSFQQLRPQLLAPGPGIKCATPSGIGWVLNLNENERKFMKLALYSILTVFVVTGSVFASDGCNTGSGESASSSTSSSSSQTGTDKPADLINEEES